VLATAGLLAGRPATTWWGRIDKLESSARSCSRRPGSSTTATSSHPPGVSAGIDMALHLVARLHSVERAREVRRYIKYDPEPPV
jgi:transcriptional regulator GlxA family with amidase domain